MLLEKKKKIRQVTAKWLAYKGISILKSHGIYSTLQQALYRMILNPQRNFVKLGLGLGVGLKIREKRIGTALVSGFQSRGKK